MRSDKDRLLDILEALQHIRRRIGTDQVAFMADELLQVWAVHHLQLIGEAAAGISNEVRARHRDVPWVDMVAMRNVLVHQYFGIDWNQVWNTIAIDLPPLESQIKLLLRE